MARADEGSAADILADDEFGKAFDSFTAGLDSTEEKPEETPEVKPEETPEEKPEETPEEKPEPAAATTPAPATVDDVTRIVTEAIKKPEPAAPAPAPAADEPKDEESPEAQAALAELEKDWSTHKLAVETLLKRQEKLLTDKFEKILEPLKAQIAPVAAHVTADAQARFEQTLKSVHADAYDIVPQVEEWIAKQPAVLQPAYNHALDKGTVEDVIEVFNLYKKSLPAAPDPAAEAAKAAAQAAEAQRKEKLERMASPQTARTSVTAEADPADFDSAFEAGSKIALQSLNIG